MRPSSPALLALASLLLLTPGLPAWGRLGHSTIARIAQSHLSPAALGGTARLLETTSTLETVASWADEVRGGRPDTAPMHYIDFAADVVTPTSGTLAWAEGNVYSAILGYSARVRDESLDLEQRREALKFLVHFVGDCHQPLHCGVTGDEGGNRVEVTFAGRPSNLHKTWDSEMLRTLGTDAPTLAAQLEKEATEEDRKFLSAPPDPLAWVVDSHAIVVNGLYPKVQGHEAPELGDDYTRRSLPLTRHQLLKGGYHLAALLNRIFDPKAPPLPPPPIPFPPGNANLGPKPLYRQP